MALSFNLGLAIPEGSLIHGGGDPDRGPDYDLDDGGVAGLGAGYGFGNGLRLEGELRYRGFDAGGISNTAFGAPSYADGSVKSTTLMTNLAYDFILKSSKLRPYVKGGIGAAWNQADADVFGPGRSAGWGLYSSATDTQFAWSLGAGLAYPIDESLSVTAQYQYMDLGSTETGGDINGQQMRFDDLGSQEITLGLRYTF
jgi:opacity protein-like surface antigen